MVLHYDVVWNFIQFGSFMHGKKLKRVWHLVSKRGIMFGISYAGWLCLVFLM